MYLILIDLGRQISILILSKKQKIKKLKARISKLQETYAEDIVSSRHEPGQTAAMIEVAKKQLEALERTETSEEGQVIELEDEKGDKKTFTIVEGTPDPNQGHISHDSDIGKILSTGKIGQKVKIGDKDYKIASIL